MPFFFNYIKLSLLSFIFKFENIGYLGYRSRKSALIESIFNQVTTVSRSEFFGESVLLRGIPSPVTVSAVSHLVVVVIAK